MKTGKVRILQVGLLFLFIIAALVAVFVMLRYFSSQGRAALSSAQSTPAPALQTSSAMVQLPTAPPTVAPVVTPGPYSPSAPVVSIQTTAEPGTSPSASPSPTAAPTPSPSAEPSPSPAPTPVPTLDPYLGGGHVEDPYLQYGDPGYYGGDITDRYL